MTKEKISSIYGKKRKKKSRNKKPSFQADDKLSFIDMMIWVFGHLLKTLFDFMVVHKLPLKHNICDNSALSSIKKMTQMSFIWNRSKSFKKECKTKTMTNYVLFYLWGSRRSSYWKNRRTFVFIIWHFFEIFVLFKRSK